MTELTITPKILDKTARFRGSVAAGEHVAVTIKGGADWLDAKLSLRVMDFTGDVLAIFPQPDTEDAWDSDAESGDLTCNLNLNSVQMLDAARRFIKVPVLFVLGISKDGGDHTLYFCDRHEVMYWPKPVGDEVPYDLDSLPGKIDEWMQTVDEFAATLSGHVSNSTIHVTALERAAWNANGETLSQLQTALSILIGSDSSESAREIAADEVAKVVAGADASFDTLKEIADWIKNDATGAAKMANDIAALKAGKVDKENGKGLSSNDFTSAYKNRLDGLDTALERKLAAKSAYPAWEQKAYSQGDVVSYKGELFKAYEDVPFEGEAPDENSSWLPATIGGLKQDALTAQQLANIEAVPNKANASEMSVTNGTGANADKTTIQLKNGTSATVLREHQDVSGKLDVTAAYPAWDDDDTYSVGDIVRHVGRVWITSMNITPDTGLVPGEGPEWSEYNGTIRSQIKSKQDALTDTQLTNIAAVPSKANASDVNAALAQKASLADLPYTLVTPSEWTYSGIEDWFSVTAIEYFDSLDIWLLSVAGDGWGNDVESSGASTDTSVEFGVNETVEPYRHATVIATKTGIHLLDRAVNAVDVSAGTTLTLPALVNAGKARDFLVRLAISGSTVPTITFSPNGNESVTYETDGDEFPVPDEAGTWLYSFTETAAGVFAVSLKQLQSVSQPTQGGS